MVNLKRHGLNILDDQLATSALCNGLWGTIKRRKAKALIEQIADGYVAPALGLRCFDKLQVLRLISSNYDLRNIFTPGAGEIAEKAYGLYRR